MKKVLLVFMLSVLCSVTFAQENHWTGPDSHSYFTNMAFIGKVAINGEIQNTADIEIAAFVVDTCRASARLRTFTQTPDQYWAFLTIYYTVAGEPLTFKIYYHGKEFEVDGCIATMGDNTVDVVTAGSMGTFGTPVILDFSVRLFEGGASDDNWNTAENWLGNVIPTADEDAIINAPAIIPEGYVAEVNHVTINANGSVTVANGGQLKQQTENLEVTMQKAIEGYSESGGYYLIAAPFTSPIAVPVSMTDAPYDLYMFDQSYPLAEWRNHKVHGFDLEQGFGYLYANIEDMTVSLTGGVSSTSDQKDIIVYYDENSNLPGFNLVGNPFTCDAYLLEGGEDYLEMNGDGTGFELAAGSAISPMKGIFVEVTPDQEVVTFVTENPNGKSKAVTLRLSNSQSAKLDAVRVRMNGGRSMNKLVLNENATKLYIPQDGKDYTVVTAEAEGRMPVNFKAATNGTYTLNAEIENTKLNYLHLIDNLTGTDVDLLANPSYSFDASTTDYASRFTLVFAENTGVGENNDAPFAFISNGNIIVNGEGTLQMVDMMGRVIRTVGLSQCGSRTIAGMTPGVYMLRLTNGNTVKTQKIAVE